MAHGTEQLAADQVYNLIKTALSAHDSPAILLKGLGIIDNKGIKTDLEKLPSLAEQLNPPIELQILANQASLFKEQAEKCMEAHFKPSNVGEIIDNDETYTQLLKYNLYRTRAAMLQENHQPIIMPILNNAHWTYLVLQNATAKFFDPKGNPIPDDIKDLATILTGEDNLTITNVTQPDFLKAADNSNYRLQQLQQLLETIQQAITSAEETDDNKDDMDNLLIKAIAYMIDNNQPPTLQKIIDAINRIEDDETAKAKANKANLLALIKKPPETNKDNSNYRLQQLLETIQQAINSAQETDDNKDDMDNLLIKAIAPMIDKNQPTLQKIIDSINLIKDNETAKAKANLLALIEKLPETNDERLLTAIIKAIDNNKLSPNSDAEDTDTLKAIMLSVSYDKNLLLEAVATNCQEFVYCIQADMEVKSTVVSDFLKQLEVFQKETDATSCGYFAPWLVALLDTDNLAAAHQIVPTEYWQASQAILALNPYETQKIIQQSSALNQYAEARDKQHYQPIITTIAQELFDAATNADTSLEDTTAFVSHCLDMSPYTPLLNKAARELITTELTEQHQAHLSNELITTGANRLSR